VIQPDDASVLKMQFDAQKHPSEGCFCATNCKFGRRRCRGGDE
jgi:hypothetical protein